MCLQSGSPLADWAAIYDIWRVQNTSRIFGEKIGCNIDTSYKLLNCLNMGRSAIEIGNVEFKVSQRAAGNSLKG